MGSPQQFNTRAHPSQAMAARPVRTRSQFGRWSMAPNNRQMILMAIVAPQMQSGTGDFVPDAVPPYWQYRFAYG
jgi:hypothetical protein